MTALEKIKDFIGQYPGADIFRDFHVDYTDQIPFNGGVFPSGLVEVSRTRDILGNTTVVNQYNFGLYYVFEKSRGMIPEHLKMRAGSWTFRSGCRKCPLWAMPPPLGMTRGRRKSPRRTAFCTVQTKKERQCTWYSCPFNSKNDL